MTVKRFLFVLILLSVAGGVVFRVVQRAELKKQMKNSKFQKNQVVPVAVAFVESKTIEEQLFLTGDIRGFNVAGVFPKVPGKMMKKIKEVGDVVTKGEVIALIDRDEPALKYAPAEVNAPLEGVITRYYVDLGQNLTQSTQLCEIAEISSVKVVVNVTEKDLPKVKLGQKARFSNDAYPGKIFEGKVMKISEALDLTTRSSEVEIMADNAGNLLKPGMFARVKIILGVHENAKVVPKNALEQSMEKYYVYLVTEGKAYRKEVRPGLVFEEEVEILSGVESGGQVITIGWHNVNDGGDVEIVS